MLEVLPNTEPFWIQTYGKVALTGEPCGLDAAKSWQVLHCRAYSPEPGQFVVVLKDATARVPSKIDCEMALTDSLTGLHNRHYLETNLQRFTAKTVTPECDCRRCQRQIINDSMGHRWGDEVLRQVAQILKK